MLRMSVSVSRIRSVQDMSVSGRQMSELTRLQAGVISHLTLNFWQSINVGAAECGRSHYSTQSYTSPVPSVVLLARCRVLPMTFLCASEARYVERTLYSSLRRSTTCRHIQVIDKMIMPMTHLPEIGAKNRYQKFWRVWRAIWYRIFLVPVPRKGPFIATQLNWTQLNSTRRRVELSCVAINTP